jgi:hypothetical protein
VARPPVAQERLEVTPAGRVVLGFKRAWRSGAHAVVFDPPGLHRPAGCTDPSAALQYGSLSRRTRGSGPRSPRGGSWPMRGGRARSAASGVRRQSRHRGRGQAKLEAPWAWLLRRVFGVDVLTCERCEGRMRLVEIANEPDEISRVLAKVWLGPRPPPRRRPALPGQLELKFAA